MCTCTCKVTDITLINRCVNPDQTVVYSWCESLYRIRTTIPLRTTFIILCCQRASCDTNSNTRQLSPTCRISGPQFSLITPTSEFGLSHQNESGSRPSQSTISPPKQLFGVKLCGDNFDWRIVPSSLCGDKQAQSVHCFHSFGSRDRTDLSGLSDIQPTLRVSQACPK